MVKTDHKGKAMKNSRLFTMIVLVSIFTAIIISAQEKFVPDSDALNVPEKFRNSTNSMEIWDFKYKEPIYLPFEITKDDLVILFGRHPDVINKYSDTIMYTYDFQDGGFVLIEIDNNNKLAMFYPRKTTRYTLPGLKKLPIEEDNLEQIFGNRTGEQGEEKDPFKYVFFNDKKFPGLRLDIKKDDKKAYGFRLWGPAWYKYL